MQEQTCAIIKPDAVAMGYAGAIIETIERNHFSIVAMHKTVLTKEEAEAFYEMHKQRSFFGELVEFVTSGPVIVMILECPHAIVAWRELMGATNPIEARPGTLRAMFGTDVGKNATHGSDSADAARREIALLFGE
jgi:nucleoside-diphosphate kinase